MASHFDPKDPGTDPDYCDGLAPELDPCPYCGRDCPPGQDYCSDECRIDAEEDDDEKT